MKLRQREPGRTRVKLAKLLEEALPDIKLHPSALRREVFLKTPMGIRLWPINKNDNFCRWAGIGMQKRKNPQVVRIGGFDTMTMCVKHGIRVVRDTPTSFDVYAKAQA